MDKNRRAPDDKQFHAIARADRKGTLPETDRRIDEPPEEALPVQVPEPVQEVVPDPTDGKYDEIEVTPPAPEEKPRRWWQI
jgi:hypothetical protein